MRCSTQHKFTEFCRAFDASLRHFQGALSLPEQSVLVDAFVLLEGNESDVRLALKLLRLLDETEDLDTWISSIF